MKSYEDPQMSYECDLTAQRDRLREINAELVAALELMVRSHAPTINGLCKICHHYGSDCEANIARAAIAKARGTA